MQKILLVFFTMLSLRLYAKEFKLNIPGPKRYDSKIAIVGAGPSGVHMAHLLKQKGFTNVVILEKSSRIGGKSYTIQYRGAYHDLGSVALAPNARRNVIPLAERYLPGELIKFPSAAYWTSGGTFHISEYEFMYSMKKYRTTDGNYIRWILYDAIRKYLRLHKLIFGDYEFALMPEPSKMGMHMIRGSMEQFLKRYNLEVLTPILEDATGSGYGQLNETAALYFLMWNNVEYIRPFLRALSKPRDHSGIYLHTLKRGTQSLWEAIVKKDNLKVVLNVDIHQIHRVLNDTPNILIRKKVNNGRLHWERFDWLIWSPEMKISLPFFSELYPYEHELFSRTNVMYWTTSITNEENTKRSFSPLETFVDNLKLRVENSVWMQGDSYGIRHGQHGIAYENGEFRSGNDSKKMRSLVTYQVGYKRSTPTIYRSKLEEHFTNLGGEILGVRNMTIWRYFPRYRVKDIDNGILWRILDMQGMYGMWYIGSSVSFESLRDVVEYNKLIVRYMTLPIN